MSILSWIGNQLGKVFNPKKVILGKGTYPVRLPNGEIGTVTVIPVKASQLPQPKPGSNLEPQVSDRMEEAPGQWAIVFNEDLPPEKASEAISWEMDQITAGTTWDKN